MTEIVEKKEEVGNNGNCVLLLQLLLPKGLREILVITERQ